MSDTNLDWTFDNIPAEGEAPGPVSRAAPPDARRRWPRWLGIALAAVGLLAGLGMLAFTRLGWARLQAQVTAEILYEHERSLAQDSAAVRALLAPGDNAWLLQRAAEVALGLAAPLPAGSLLPTSAAPRVVAVQANGEDQFVATVVREYADSAGTRFEFELPQRYHLLGPGLWERLPADAAALANTTVFVSDHLSVTFPVADLPWLTEALPQFEATLARACLDWQCPPGTRLAVVFGARVYAAKGVLRATRPLAAAGAYPLIFDLPPAPVATTRTYRFTSPRLTGYPRDAAAAAALTRATRGQLLAALAAELAGINRRGPDFFLDALVAREEQRLGLSTASAAAITPYEYVSPAQLWGMAGQGELAAVTDSLSLRRQALAFVDFALAGQPPRADGILLRQLHLVTNPTDWLRAALPDTAADIPARWRANVLSVWTAAARPGYEGQVLVCGPQALVLSAAGLRSFASRPQGQSFIAGELSPDGRTLAALIAGRSTTKLVLFNLEDGALQPLPVAQPGTLLGWRPTGELLYLEVHPANGRSNFYRLMRLRQYDPAGRGTFSTLLDGPVVLPWSERGLWSPDRRTLTLAVYRGGPDDDLPSELVLVTPGGNLAVRTLLTPGYAPAFSLQGDRLALFSGGDPFLGLTHENDWRLNLLDLRQNQLTTMLTAAEIGAADFSQVGALEWSADGRWLTFLLVGSGGGPVAYLAAAVGGQVRPLEVGTRNGGSLPLGFSADSRYLAVLVFGGAAGTNEIVVFDLAQPEAAPQRYLAQTAAWSRQGHHLLMGGAAGIYTLDPATNSFEWLYDTTCAVEFA